MSIRIERYVQVFCGLLRIYEFWTSNNRDSSSHDLHTKTLPLVAYWGLCAVFKPPFAVSDTRSYDRVSCKLW